MPPADHGHLHLPAPTPRRALLSRLHDSRGGFSVIELVVVCMIIGILVGLASMQYSSQKRKARENGIAIAGADMAQAIESYKMDHGGLVPAFGGTDWPVALNGPLDLRGLRYVGGELPEATAGGWAKIGTSEGAGRGSYGSIVYVPSSETNYKIQVYVLKNGAAVLKCEAGIDAAPTMKCG